ncbi:MAG: VWA domain-containing protein [Clostridia bacterium]|nr:VWA domain-containing protein [Clostridia bacterium]
MKITDMREGMAQKELHIFYLLDTSGSMGGAPIASLNDAMRDTVNAMGDIRAKADLKLGIMTYDTEARWVTGGQNNLENVDDFVWNDVEAGGMTFLGEALGLLKAGLSRNTMMASETGNNVPIIIFMTDGMPNDNWEAALKEIRENKWYQAATKIGIALGESADVKVLSELVGDPEAILRTNDLQQFKKLLRVVSVTSTLVGSRSTVTTNGQTGADIVRAVEEKVEDKDFDDDDLV